MKKILIFPLLLSALLLSGCSDTNSSALTNTAVPSTTSSKATVPAVAPSTKTSASENTTNPNVKKSTSGICHAKGSTYYGRTLNFTAYDTIDDCLNSGGRMPKK